MSVLQLAKRSVTVLATVCVALTGCGDSGPDVPFNPAGTSADLEAMNSTFASPVFSSFAAFSLQFDAALAPAAPLISASAQAFDFRRATTPAGLRAAARRNAERVAALAMPKATNRTFSASSAAIPAEVAGKTFEYADGSYVPGTRPGAPANGVRFLIYAVNPVTFEPVLPLAEVGYVELTDLSGSSTQAARVIVVSGETTYLDYTVRVAAATGQVTVAGFVTDGTNRANLNLLATVTEAAGLTLLYRVDVPQRGLSIDLGLTMTGLDTQSGTIGINLSVSGPNGRVSMVGEITEAGGTLTVRVNGNTFATITSSGTADPVITGANGQPLSDDEAAALQEIFEVTGEAFTAFDEMIVPVGGFLEPAA